MSVIHIITPVKDSLITALETIDGIMCSDTHNYVYTVYDDYSTSETRDVLRQKSEEKGFNLVHLSDLTDHPSPNYLVVLQHAQRQALADKSPLLIVESDVIVRQNTISELLMLYNTVENPGMIAAVTTDETGKINFPYLFASHLPEKTISTTKRLSFCCTLLTPQFLSNYDFSSLNPDKNWYDVFITRQSIASGFTNYLALNIPVLHKPHSSRPWKLEKYSNPIKYYWKKITQGRDKI